MTLNGFIQLIQGIDPNAERYDAIGQPGDKYTVYSDYMHTTLWADGEAAENIHHVQVEYYTDEEDDPTAQHFLDAFSENGEICFSLFSLEKKCVIIIQIYRKVRPKGQKGPLYGSSSQRTPPFSRLRT